MRSQANFMTSISLKDSYEEIGEFWDSHDVTEFGEESSEVEFEVALQSDFFCDSADELI